MIPLLFAALLAAPRAPRPAPVRQPAQAQQPLSDAELQRRVNNYLNVLDRPIPPARWQELGERAAPLLEAVIANPNEFPSRRAMAVDALAAAAPARARQLLGGVARDEAQPTAVRVAAVHGAAALLDADQAVQELGPVLRAAKSAGMRAEAADALSRTQGGCAEVRDQV
ncbi:MAG TPA: hypothetical protein VFP52_00910, partial [Myxococcales bacterium]|nr:hypothetical protein [Myxococcales bacterium]